MAVKNYYIIILHYIELKITVLLRHFLTILGLI